MQECNIENILSDDISFKPSEEEQSALFDTLISPGYKVLKKLINIQALKAINSSIYNTSNQSELNRGKALAYYDLDRELRNSEKKYIKKQNKKV